MIRSEGHIIKWNGEGTLVRFEICKLIVMIKDSWMFLILLLYNWEDGFILRYCSKTKEVLGLFNLKFEIVHETV